MADNYLITGYWGEPHVTAENDRGINAAMFGAGRFVLPVGEQFKAEYIGNNTIRMYDGKLMDNGAAAGIPAGEYVDLLIANAGQGMKRNDLIVFQYEQDSVTLVESGKFVVIQGTETNGVASDPELTQSDLLSGKATFDQMALWRVPVTGGSISDPVKLFSVYQFFSSHAEDTNNPHKVTAEQVGADPLNSSAKVQKNLDSHTADKNNPHGVTAAQVGARPNTWVPTASQVGAIPRADTQETVFHSVDESGFKTNVGITSYPTTGGVYRTTKFIDGLPSGVSGYGMLAIFKGQNYELHIHKDVINKKLYEGQHTDTAGRPVWNRVITADCFSYSNGVLNINI